MGCDDCCAAVILKWNYVVSEKLMELIWNLVPRMDLLIGMTVRRPFKVFLCCGQNFYFSESHLWISILFLCLKLHLPTRLLGSSPAFVWELPSSIFFLSKMSIVLMEQVHPREWLYKLDRIYLSFSLIEKWIFILQANLHQRTEFNAFLFETTAVTTTSTTAYRK